MRRNKGFTLIEVMIVVVIVGILAAVAIPNYSDYVTRSKTTEAVSALSDAKVRMEQYFQDNRYYSSDGAAGSTDCGVTMPATTHFTFACVSSNNGQAYVWTATGTLAMVGFTYTINQVNARGSSTSAAAIWPSLTGTGCWIATRSGC